MAPAPLTPPSSTQFSQFHAQNPPCTQPPSCRPHAAACISPSAATSCGLCNPSPVHNLDMCRWLNNKFPGKGLLPTRLNRNKGSFAGMRTYTMGANADSYYEYLLKMWLLKQQKVYSLQPWFWPKGILLHCVWPKGISFALFSGQKSALRVWQKGHCTTLTAQPFDHPALHRHHCASSACIIIVHHHYSVSSCIAMLCITMRTTLLHRPRSCAQVTCTGHVHRPSICMQGDCCVQQLCKASDRRYCSQGHHAV